MRALQVIFLLGCWIWVLSWAGAALHAWVNEQHARHVAAALDRTEQRTFQATRGVTRP